MLSLECSIAASLELLHSAAWNLKQSGSRNCKPACLLIMTVCPDGSITWHLRAKGYLTQHSVQYCATSSPSTLSANVVDTIVPPVRTCIVSSSPYCHIGYRLRLERVSIILSGGPDEKVTLTARRQTVASLTAAETSYSARRAGRG